MTCAEPGCGRGGRLRRGLCGSHYGKLCTQGLPPRPLKPASQRFWEKVAQAGDCWEWRARMSSVGGYGLFAPDGHNTVCAHRFAYEDLIGPIPDGLQLDHLCQNSRCVNPYHLDPVTPRVNVMRSNNSAGINSRKTQCKRGHPFDEVNTGINGRGHRFCLTCRRTAYPRSKQAAA